MPVFSPFLHHPQDAISYTKNDARILKICKSVIDQYSDQNKRKTIDSESPIYRSHHLSGYLAKLLVPACLFWNSASFTLRQGHESATFLIDAQKVSDDGYYCTFRKEPPLAGEYLDWFDTRRFAFSLHCTSNILNLKDQNYAIWHRKLRWHQVIKAGIGAYLQPRINPIKLLHLPSLYIPCPAADCTTSFPPQSIRYRDRTRTTHSRQDLAEFFIPRTFPRVSPIELTQRTHKPSSDGRGVSRHCSPKI